MGGPEPPIADEPDPFDAFETFAETIAFIYKKLGGKFLREFLAEDPNKPINERSSRQFWQRQADELNAVGLHKVAAIVADRAKRAPHELDQCPYPDTPEKATSRRAWFYSKRQKYGLCPWCGSDKKPDRVCNNGETCVERMENAIARSPPQNLAQMINNGWRR
jgi:hypothetical protein